MNAHSADRALAETRFAAVFGHLDFLTAYARRRGSRDAEAVAGEAMAIAWRRLADVPVDDARPWLIATTRNLLLAERRRQPDRFQDLDGIDLAAPEPSVSVALDLDPDLAAGLSALSDQDREALLLVAWEDLTPALAAASLGITASAFRVRLHRARRRLTYELSRRVPDGAVESRSTSWRQS
jgi:RNA polymerase sigma-70 factor (ECF subfamily)